MFSRIIIALTNPVVQKLFFSTVLSLIVSFLVAGYSPSIKRFRQQFKEAGAEKRKLIFIHLWQGASFGSLAFVSTYAVLRGFYPYLTYWSAVVSIANFLIAFYQFIRPLNEHEFLLAYKRRPDRCPHCQYNITNLTRRQCPECDWHIPDVNQIQVQSPTTWRWWKQWRIDYIYRPIRLICLSMFAYFVYMLLLSPVAYFIYVSRHEINLVYIALLLAILGGLALHLVINLVRIIQYICSRVNDQSVRHQLRHIASV
ncbi:hypothetical protein [Poriferisphaera sp. WC338]|uniref:hypothetical protein n=1 Tax=Poriferisphaera sp. WC338 TaxID=3425129 RepID=UPI003D813941